MNPSDRCLHAKIFDTHPESTHDYLNTLLDNVEWFADALSELGYRVGRTLCSSKCGKYYYLYAVSGRNVAGRFSTNCIEGDSLCGVLVAKPARQPDWESEGQITIPISKHLDIDVVFSKLRTLGAA